MSRQGESFSTLRARRQEDMTFTPDDEEHGPAHCLVVGVFRVPQHAACAQLTLDARTRYRIPMQSLERK